MTTSPKNPDDPKRSWLKPPLSTDESPVSESSLLAGVLALGDSTDGLTDAVITSTRTRRTLLALMTAATVVFLLTSVYGSVVYSRLSTLTTANHQTGVENQRLLRDVESVTNPDAQQTSIARSDARVAKQTQCIEDFLEHNYQRTDPSCPPVPAR